MTDGEICRMHAAECFRLAYLSFNLQEIRELSSMACHWTDLGSAMDEEDQAAVNPQIIN
jgi:hypothetical protein